MMVDESERLLADGEAYCQELRPFEEACYTENRFIQQAIDLAKKYDLLGMPIAKEYGGREAGPRTLWGQNNQP